MINFPVKDSYRSLLRQVTKFLFHAIPPDVVEEEEKCLNLPPALDDGISTSRVNSESLPIAIVGAGVAGMRVAMMLDYLGLPYEIFEASSRHGGRCFTHYFTKEENSGLKYDYFDVGAMRYPNNQAMKGVYDLFKELDITVEGGKGGKLIQFITSAPGNVCLFNGMKREVDEVSVPGDHFGDSAGNRGPVPEEYITKQFTKSNGQNVYGVEACFASAFEPFKDVLAQDNDAGWDLLMKYDEFSTRSFLLQIIGYPPAVVEWIEMWHGGTGAFRGGFVQEVMYSFHRDYPSNYARPINNIDRLTPRFTQNGIKMKIEDADWWCIEGGSEVLSNAMHATLKTKALYSHRVTSIAASEAGENRPQTMKIAVAGHPEISARQYSHVISTVPLSCLRMINLDDCGLDYQQKTALRALEYTSAVKVGIKFRTRWWQHDSRFATQTGGASLTDRPSRMVVYPSYGLDDAPDAPGVLIVAYVWDQDASRLGSLIKSKDWDARERQDHGSKSSPDDSEKFLLSQIYQDLAALHGQTPEWYERETLDHFAFDWYHNQYTMGAYVYPAPGQFSAFYPSIVKPAAGGHFHIGGEAASKKQTWVAGALESAWRCVHEILVQEESTKLGEFRERWGTTE
ncbi:hypothetical protein GALMADRAFT_147787 [Galerina marginata CBS 339.88]|uniref:Amine oxidase domain-containing protein n=1 Tax=Galerina marginata (strain CBS 339.88) TaxID=685588 RepID=A0A067SFQ6_GALM3|nr:hypothetical protein GALMADRAFT_147787 [Galerina marginata CBS 339.88]